MRTILGVTLLALASWTGAYAQAVAGFGGITGTVTDSSANDGLPDATLILTNESLGIKRTFLASDDGIFDMPALVPASGYGLKVTRKGYTPRTISNLTVPVGDTLNLIVPMDREGSSVKSEFKMAAVEDNKNVISMNITPEQLESLPSPSRVLGQFVLLAPSVTLGTPHRRHRDSTVRSLPILFWWMATTPPTPTSTASPELLRSFPRMPLWRCRP